MTETERSHEVSIAIDARCKLRGQLSVPEQPLGIVVVAQPAGSGRRLTRQQELLRELARADLATLVVELLSEREADEDRFRRRLHLDIPLLGGRLILTIMWLRRQPDVYDLPVGLFGTNTCAAAALVAAAHETDRVRAVVTRSGRLDLVPDDDVTEVRASTLVIVGGSDVPVIAATRSALPRFSCPMKLEVVAGAAHLFERPDALDRANALTSAWFRRELGGEEAVTQRMRPAASSRR